MLGWSRRWVGCWGIRRHRRVTLRELLSSPSVVELRRILLPRTPVNRARRKSRAATLRTTGRPQRYRHVRRFNCETLAPLARAYSSISVTVSSDASRTNILSSPSCNILKRTPGTNTVVRARSTSVTSDQSNSILGPPKTCSNARPTIPGREERRLPPFTYTGSTEKGQVLVDTEPPASSQLAPLIQVLEPISFICFRHCGLGSTHTDLCY